MTKCCAFGAAATLSSSVLAKPAAALRRSSIELAPDRIVHHAEFAKALDTMGDRTAAREQWQQVVELKPVFAQDRRYQEMALKRLELP